MAYTSNKKINGLDSAVTPLGAGNEIVLSQAGNTVKTNLASVEAKIFDAKAATDNPTGTEVVVVRQTDNNLRQVALADIVPAGNIVDAKISASAAIADTKLATINTTGKVTNNAVQAVSTNTANRIVTRDSSGNFAANAITATTFTGTLAGSATGNAGTATVLATGRTIALTGDVTGTTGAFDGSANVSAATTIANNAVTTAKIADANVTTAKIADANVTNVKIASGVDAAKLTTGTLPAARIGNDAIDAAKIASNAVTNVKIASGVDAAKLTTGTLPIARIADGAVTNAKLATGAVTGAAGGGKLAASAISGQTAITTLTDDDAFIVHDDNDATLKKITKASLSSELVGDGSITAAKMSGVAKDGAGADLAVGTPPVFGCRAWVNFDGTRDTTGAASTANTNRLIRASGNVSSVLRNSIGNYTVTFTAAMPDANYVSFLTGDGSGGRANTWGRVASNNAAPTSAAVRIQISDDQATTLDAALINVAIFR